MSGEGRKTRLPMREQIERFGMSFAQAHRVRDRAQAALSEKDITAARRAWQDLVYELRGSKGHQFQCSRHPEAVRVKMLSCLAGGASLDDAVNAARRFAYTEAD